MKNEPKIQLKSLFVWMVLLGLNLSVNAQLADTARIIVQDGWVEKMDNNIALKVSLNNAYETFSQDQYGSAYKVSLYPNITTNLSIGLDYRFISASFQFAPAFIPGNADNDIHGQTKSFSLGFSTIFTHWAAAVKYSHVKGYYLQNTPEIDTTWRKGDPYFQLPDHETYSFSANIGYSFNSKLSVRSLTTFTERQLKSAGSFIPAVNIEYFHMNANQTPGVNGVQTNPKSGNLEAVVGPAYFYTFVLKEKFFVSAGLHGGIGMVWSKYTIEYVGSAEYGQSVDVAYRWDAKAGIGYNGRDFFTGLYLNVGDTFYEPNHNSIIQDLQAYYQFVIGVRLASPKWLKKQMKKLDDKVKL